MKLIFAIVNNDDASVVSSALTKSGYGVTKLATTGGFLKAGNTTFLIGIDNDKVERVLEIIRKYSSKRTQALPDMASYTGEFSPSPIQVTVGGATIFVTDVERFEKL
jgi:uncharacterized protein YaaQ